MRRLCFGGSFNPIHNGHLICSRAVAAKAGFDRIVLIPSSQPPHKPGQGDMAEAQDRLAMCRLATEGDQLYEISDIELKRSGPSYTIQTARELRRLGWDEVNWLIGADQVLGLPTWRQPLDLLAEVNFVIMARPGWEIDWPALPEQFSTLQSHVVAAPLVDVSATNIRQRVRTGLPVDHLTPPSVAHYIEKHRLYR